METTQPVKLALCMQRADAPAAFNEATTERVIPFDAHMLARIQTALIDRAVCEKDESTLQLIPYIVLRDTNGNILRYSRGKGGAEARLHAKTSIGFGGHVDVEAPFGHLFDILHLEAKRELHEELGLTVTGDLSFTHLIVDPSDAVGWVHIGFLAIYTVPDDAALKLEAGVIEGVEWVHPPKLVKLDDFRRLEGWSRAVALYLNR